MISVVNRWDDSRSKEERRYERWASTDLLDYSYPAELFSIIRSEWSWFLVVFGGDIAVWQTRFQILEMVRTPLAHNRVPESYRGVLDEAAGICKQVLDRVLNWERALQDDDREWSESQ